jgi:hypothetical protein
LRIPRALIALPSGPLVGDLREATDQGSDGSIEECLPADKMVETRRLELLTLSLQRRCSTS